MCFVFWVIKSKAGAARDGGGVTRLVESVPLLSDCQFRPLRAMGRRNNFTRQRERGGDGGRGVLIQFGLQRAHIQLMSILSRSCPMSRPGRGRVWSRKQVHRAKARARNIAIVFIGQNRRDRGDPQPDMEGGKRTQHLSSFA